MLLGYSAITTKDLRYQTSEAWTRTCRPTAQDPLWMGPETPRVSVRRILRTCRSDPRPSEVVSDLHVYSPDLRTKRSRTSGSGPGPPVGIPDHQGWSRTSTCTARTSGLRGPGPPEVVSDLQWGSRTIRDGPGPPRVQPGPPTERSGTTIQRTGHPSCTMVRGRHVSGSHSREARSPHVSQDTWGTFGLKETCPQH